MRSAANSSARRAAAARIRAWSGPSRSRRRLWAIMASTSPLGVRDRKSTRLNSSHGYISYAVFCLKKKKIKTIRKITRLNSGQGYKRYIVFFFTKDVTKAVMNRNNNGYYVDENLLIQWCHGETLLA